MAAATSTPPWKLFQNPHFSSNSWHEESKTRTPPHQDSSSSSNKLTCAFIEVDELQAELELHCRMSWEAKSLKNLAAYELSKERRTRMEVEAEVERWCKVASRALKEVEEDHHMMKLAEVWREEHVHMKLAKAAIILEERMW